MSLVFITGVQATTLTNEAGTAVPAIRLPEPHPITFRLPKVGHTDLLFGLNRSWWNEKILPTPRNKFKPPIRSIVDRKTGARTGVRLIITESAVEYLNNVAAKNTAEGSGEA